MDSNGIYPVRFRDLINELSSLFMMNPKEDLIGYYVTTSVCYYGKYNLDEMIELMNDKQFNFRYGHDYLHVIMYGKKKNKIRFFYNIHLPLNFDDKRIREFFNVEISNEHLNNLNYSKIQVNDIIDDLILYFNDDILKKKEEKDFYPCDLLKKAVYNCYKRNTFINKK